MNIYGERYAEVGLFIGHCEDLNVRTERTELERYERTGVMFPVARVVYPSEFIVQLDQHEQDGDYGWNGFDKWPELVKLTEKFRPLPTRDKTLTDEELIHCFDRTLDSGGHPYLSVPRADTFRPWSEYQTQIVDSSGQTFGRATADHYYSHCRSTSSIYSSNTLTYTGTQVSSNNFRQIIHSRHSCAPNRRQHGSEISTECGPA